MSQRYKETHVQFTYYLHGAQLASAFYCFRIEPLRDHHPLKDPGKDIISILCRTYW